MKKMYDRIVGVLSGIPTDKYIHCIVTMVIASVLMHLIPIASVHRLFLSVVLTVVVGVAKELYDKNDYVLFDRRDFLADVVGAVLGAIMSL